MTINQAKLKYAIKSALDDMFDTKFASLDTKLEPLQIRWILSLKVSTWERKLLLWKRQRRASKGKSVPQARELPHVSNAVNQMKSGHSTIKNST